MLILQIVGSSPTGDCTYNPSNGAYNVGCMTKLALPLRIAFWSIPSTMFVCLVLSIMVCSAGDRDQYDDDRNTYHSANERHRRKVCTIIIIIQPFVKYFERIYEVFDTQ